ncbi:pimeloyl-ACP methyl ester carboxylesterase [Crossiella equi]|uniref:Pimeloyl-ACP methyl ester carboxylesterase n=1 Tax=Crossiella equi TaxID=130796 RepID=A0ABS5ARX3_9PSEU|nr:alpha/beta hydrolase [Crossiella equi]MBP2478982.1 pimeloyl-ACP methyl ester carboxylesterase [Crossiella equi]
MDRRTLLSTLGATAALAMTGTPASAAPEATSGARVPSDAVLARSLGLRSAHAEVNGTRLHYVTGGTGSPLVLLPGWPQTWWEFNKVLPALAKRHTVIAVDLRGMGGSAKPEGGYDKKTMARDIHELIRRLGHRQADVAGHDIGAHVAYSLAANHPGTVRRLALLDGVHPEESLYQFTLIPQPGQPFFPWWFAFNQVRGLPEQLIVGRFRVLVDYFCQLLLVDQGNINELARSVYAHAYDNADAIRAGNSWYQGWVQDIQDDKAYGPLEMPVLGLGASSTYHALLDYLPRKARDQRVREITGSGHFIAEEQPGQVVAALTEFLR